MDENNSFKSVDSSNFNSSYKEFNNKSKGSSSGGFGKNVILPFMFGILGCIAVIGACLNIPSLKENIVKQLVTSNISTSEDSSIENTNTNNQLISLIDYSGTSIAVAKKVQPSIVGIAVEYSVNSIFSFGQSKSTATGSGIIISEDGYILTNNHIVNSTSESSFYELGKANKVTVTLFNDDTEYEAKIIGTDSLTDLAVIKIEKTGLQAAELGDSDSVQVGEFAMAVGNPLGMSNSVTAGIVSAINREVSDGEGNNYVAIQTDAAINTGNSGGALVNSKGQVIGVNTLKLSGTGVEGMGFAIPINSTKEIYEQLIQFSKVKRPYIGIGGIDLDEFTASRNNLVVGVYIKTIENFSAAEKAGLKVGDVITGVDGTKISTMDELNNIKNSKKIGDTITLTIYRDSSESEITLTLQEQP